MHRIFFSKLWFFSGPENLENEFSWNERRDGGFGGWGDMDEGSWEEKEFLG